MSKMTEAEAKSFVREAIQFGAFKLSTLSGGSEHAIKLAERDAIYVLTLLQKLQEEPPKK